MRDHFIIIIIITFKVNLFTHTHSLSLSHLRPNSILKETTTYIVLFKLMSLTSATTQTIEEQAQKSAAVPVTTEPTTSAAKSDDKPLKQRSIFGKYESKLPTPLASKTAVCKHHHGCFENIVKDALKNFLMGLALQTALKNIGSIGKPAKLMRNL